MDYRLGDPRWLVGWTCGCGSGTLPIRVEEGREGTRLSSPSLPSLTHRYIYVLGKKTFLMQWPSDGDVGKKELLDQMKEFSEYMSIHGCES